MSYFLNELLSMYMANSITYVKEDTLRVFSNGLTITYYHKSTLRSTCIPKTILYASISTTQQNLFLKNPNNILHYCSRPRFVVSNYNITHVIKVSVVNIVLTHTYSIWVC